MTCCGFSGYDMVRLLHKCIYVSYANHLVMHLLPQHDLRYSNIFMQPHSNQLTMSQERGHARATVQGPTLDGVLWHCELAVASRCIEYCHKCFFLCTWLSHTFQSHFHFYTDHLRFYSHFAATPHPAIMQERGQVGGATQELTHDDISQHCESEVAYSYFSSV